MKEGVIPEGLNLQEVILFHFTITVYVVSLQWKVCGCSVPGECCDGYS